VSAYFAYTCGAFLQTVFCFYLLIAAGHCLPIHVNPINKLEVATTLLWFRASLACADTLASYTVLLHSHCSRFKMTADKTSNLESQLTGLTFEAPISVQRIPPTFTIYYFIHVLYCINSPRVPLPYRSRLSTSDQRLLLRPSFYPFS
jgi:hypothetical protein